VVHLQDKLDPNFMLISHAVNDGMHSSITDADCYVRCGETLTLCVRIGDVDGATFYSGVSFELRNVVATMMDAHESLARSHMMIYTRYVIIRLILMLLLMMTYAADSTSKTTYPGIEFDSVPRFLP